MPDLSQIPGYRGQEGPPADYIPETRTHTVNKYDNARFGLGVRSEPENPLNRMPWEWPCGAPFPCLDQFGNSFEPGVDELFALRPMRATDLRNVTETIPGGWFEYSYTPQLSPIDGDHPQEYTYEDVARAKTDVVVKFSSTGDWGSGAEYAEVFIGGHNVGQIFKTTGFEYPAYSYSDLTVAAEDWNRGINDAKQLTILVVPTSAVGATSGSWIKWRVPEYQGSDTIVHDWAHQEVCLYHRGYGFVVNAEGEDEPVIIIQPVRLDPGLIVAGRAWMVPADDEEGLGEPGEDVLVFPVELPWNVETVFASYPVACGFFE